MMSASILIIEYDISDVQLALPRDAWKTRASQISKMPGLRWKYWLQNSNNDERGGVYHFGSQHEAEHAAHILTESLRDVGARNVRHHVYEVDTELSNITRGIVLETS